MFLRRPLAAPKTRVLLPGAVLFLGLAFTGIAGKLYHDAAQDALLNGPSGAWLILLCGSVLSIALAVTARSLASARGHSRVEQELRVHRDDLQRMIEERTREMVTALIRAEAANRAKSEFLANMSHELRTPMHAILSFAKLGVEKSAGEEREGSRLPQYFARIHASGQRLLALLDDLLDLSKLEAGKMHYAMGEHDIGAALADALAELEELAHAKNLRFGVKASAEGTHAWFDPVRMGQVLRNLISNAIRFSPAGAEIRITIAHAMLPAGRRADDPPAIEALKLTISDRGPGIPPKELNSVFDKFVQSTKTRSGTGGTGLGLSISREIIVAHGGRIEASNNPDGGASLSFTIPMKAPPAAEAEVLEAA